MQAVDERNDSRTQEHLKSVPSKYRLLMTKTILGRAGKASAVKAMCYQCVGYTSVKEMIGGCTSKICPLWHYRPYK